MLALIEYHDGKRWVFHPVSKGITPAFMVCFPVVQRLESAFFPFDQNRNLPPLAPIRGLPSPISDDAFMAIEDYGEGTSTWCWPYELRSYDWERPWAYEGLSGPFVGTVREAVGEREIEALLAFLGALEANLGKTVRLILATGY